MEGNSWEDEAARLRAKLTAEIAAMEAPQRAKDAEYAAAAAVRRRSADNKTWLQIGTSVLALALASATAGAAFPAGAPLFFVIAVIFGVIGIYVCGATLNRWPLIEPTEKVIWPSRIVTVVCIVAIIATGVYALRNQSSGGVAPTPLPKTSLPPAVHRTR